ncbi:MAG: FAD:protein FMN transferase [Gammaproteobacteria bacterium]|nr:MAG: FAD:protein FMN transferase [Gammaproteobacteria bacterium]
MNYIFTSIFQNTPKVFGYLFLLTFSFAVNAEWQTEDATIMGTTIRIEVWHADANVRQKGIDKVLEEMERINRLMSPYIEQSQLSKINKHAHEGPVEVDRDLFTLIEKSLEVSQLTNGAFDITYASVGHLFNYRKEIKPTEEEIAAAKLLIDYKNIVLDKTQLSVSFLKQGVKIDLGGIAKGFAVDLSIQHLQDLAIKHALVSAGGDTRLLGDRHGRAWLVGIRDPSNTEEVIVMLPLQDEALSTSGDYERFFVEDGKKYHHIIHPITGYSASEVRSASILASDSTTTDALSTSIFVMGASKGLALLNSLDGVEGVIVDQQGKLYYSKGLEKEQQMEKSP